MTYVISDIHGCFNEFIKLLELIKFKEEDELYILGDVVDRGPHPIKTLLYIMNQKNMHMILGNHEKMMIESKDRDIPYMLRKESEELWLYNGGKITDKQFKTCTSEQKKNILRYIKGLPLGLEVCVRDNSYIMVHGGPSNDFVNEWNRGDLSEDVLWNRFSFLSTSEIVYPDKIIIVGHTPTSLYGYDGIIFAGDKRLIDCGCVFGDRLGCLCLNTEECFYVEKKAGACSFDL